ncbi:pectinesterase-like protein [Tanacetum coccineum]
MSNPVLLRGAYCLLHAADSCQIISLDKMRKAIEELSVLTDKYKEMEKELADSRTVVNGNGFIAKDIGFENSVGPNKHQAVTLRVSTDMTILRNCVMEGHQDTLYTHSYQQLFSKFGNIKHLQDKSGTKCGGRQQHSQSRFQLIDFCLTVSGWVPDFRKKLTDRIRTQFWHATQ